MAEAGGVSRFHFLRIVSHSVRVDYLVCMGALLFLGTVLEMLRWYAGWFAQARGDYLNSWETFLPLYYSLFVLFNFGSHLIMEEGTGFEFFRILPMTRNRQTLIRLVEPALLSLLWFYIPFWLFLQFLDPGAPHAYYLILLWILVHSLSRAAYGFEFLVSHFGRLGWVTWISIYIFGGFGLLPFAVIALYVRELHPEVFNDLVYRPNLLAAGGVILVSIVSALFFWATVVWKPWPQSLRTHSGEPASTTPLTTLDRSRPANRWMWRTQFFLPSVCTLLCFFWTVLCFRIFLWTINQFGERLLPLLMPHLGEYHFEVASLVVILFMAPFVLLYSLVGAALLWGALSVFRFMHHWQTLPLKAWFPITAVILVGAAFAFGMWLLSDFTTGDHRVEDLWNWLFSWLGLAFPPFALVGLLLANPLHWKREPGRISDPVGIVVIGASLALMGLLLPVFDRLPAGPLAAALLLVPIAYNLWAMAWMYRRY